MKNKCCDWRACVATRTECDVCERYCLRSVATHADAYDVVTTGDSSVTGDLKMASSDVKATLQK